MAASGKTAAPLRRVRNTVEPGLQRHRSLRPAVKPQPAQAKPQVKQEPRLLSDKIVDPGIAMAGNAFDACMKTKCIVGGNGVKAKGVKGTKSMVGGLASRPKKARARATVSRPRA